MRRETCAIRQGSEGTTRPFRTSASVHTGLWSLAPRTLSMVPANSESGMANPFRKMWSQLPKRLVASTWLVGQRNPSSGVTFPTVALIMSPPMIARKCGAASVMIARS